MPAVLAYLAFYHTVISSLVKCKLITPHLYATSAHTQVGITKSGLFHSIALADILES